ncbi:hypothetical protein WJX81_004691 [Elliptochloris bilobata]|uniref:ferroxidase n=1 Tax=Elliptochloris bilobata TaxID=381761 RepID=A0AAW1SCS7_9CHLO
MARKSKASKSTGAPSGSAEGTGAATMQPPLTSTRSARAGRRGREGAMPAEEQPEQLAPGARKRPRQRGAAEHRPATDGGAVAELEELEASDGGSAEQLDHFAEAVERSAKDAERLMESVVKVFCVHSEPNFSLPWQRKRQYSSTSSGFIISGKRILTNAHSVDHHTQVKVRRRGSDTKFVATVLSIGTECDIAMLTVQDPEFWKGLQPVTFGPLPRLQSQVTVIGYPIGGDTMSVTSGVVSRIEVTSYVHGSSELLGVQIDAAINAGNSGGPAFTNRGECCGIAFQSLRGGVGTHEDAEGIGYVIPVPVIEHFINDYVKNKSFSGFPALGIEWQRMESPFLRKALGMKTGQKGVYVRRVEPTSPAGALLKRGDIVLSFDGTDIANDGTVPFRSGERISFSYLVSRKYVGEQAELRVLSEGKERRVSVELSTPTRLVPVHIKNRPPSYFIFAGLVFTQVTVPFLRSEYGKEYDFDAPVKLLDAMMHAQADSRDQQVVVLAQVLAADINIGYEEGLVNTQVRAVNGKPIRNLKELVAEVDGTRKDFLKLDLEYNQLVVLEVAPARAATGDILKIKKEAEALFKAKVGCRETSFAKTSTLSDELVSGLNCAMNYSANVERLYRSAAIYFDRDNVGLPGVSMFFKVAGVCVMNEQYKIADWLNKRGGRVSFEPVAAPSTEHCEEHSDVLAAFVKSLAAVKVGFEKGNKLYEAATKAGDAHAVDFVSTSLRQKSECLRLGSHIVTHLKLVEKDKHAIKNFDRSLPNCLVDLAFSAGIESTASAKLIKGSIERVDEWKSSMVAKPLFDTPEACVAKEVWKRALV